MSFQDVQIAFAGHNRPEDLDDSAAARASLDHALRMLAAAGVTSGRLITGVADGADLLAVAAWNATGLGPTHAVYPFLRDPAATFPAGHGREETWLDGEGFEAGGRSAYLAQSRWLVESADILLAVWGGDAARGPGGTADAVRLAMERGIAILWIQPQDYEGLKLITPPDVDDFFSFNELLQQIELGVDYITAEATAERIAAALDRQGLGRHAEVDTPGLPARRTLLSALDDLAHATIWKTYALFHRAAGGARAWRRHAGLAVGHFDGGRVRRWGDWAIGELVISQANYHRDQGRRNHRIAHRMHGLENVVFVAFITILASFAAASLLGEALKLDLPEWVGGALTMTSAVVPAIGSAVLALEANLAFSERSRESTFLASRLDRIRNRLPAEPRLHDYQRAASAAIRLHNTEQDQWAENAARRPLIKGA